MEQIVDSEKIAKSLPTEVLGQKVYKAKVLFRDVNKSDPHYSKSHDFSANFHRYRVVDGEVAFLPEEAYSALNDAVTVSRRPANTRQERDGLLDGENYIEVKNKRFDVVIIDTFTYVIDGETNKARFISQNETVSAETAQATANAMIDGMLKAKEAEIREELEAQIRAEYEQRMKSVTPEIPDEEIDKLLEETTSTPTED